MRKVECWSWMHPADLPHTWATQTEINLQKNNFINQRIHAMNLIKSYTTYVSEVKEVIRIESSAVG